jgi:hypothetical protein
MNPNGSGWTSLRTTAFENRWREERKKREGLDES